MTFDPSMLRFFGVLHNGTCYGTVMSQGIQSFYASAPLDSVKMVIEGLGLEFVSKRIVNIEDSGLFRITFFDDHIALPLDRLGEIRFDIINHGEASSDGVCILYTIST